MELKCGLVNHQRRSASLRLLERHVARAAAGCALPAFEEGSVRVSDVLRRRDMKRLRGAVDPLWRSFNLAEVADRSFIEYDVSIAVGPLAAIFVVTKHGSEPKRREDARQSVAVGDSGFRFDARFVKANRAFALVRERPRVAVAADAQHIAAPAKLAASEVVQRVDFERARCDRAKAQLAQALFERRQIGGAKLDLD